MENQSGNLEEVLKQFPFEGKQSEIFVYGSGHINDTYCVVRTLPFGVKKYILQRMNHRIFSNIEQLMNNIVQVTQFLRKKIIQNGGDPERETLNVLFTKDNQPYYTDQDGFGWRVYHFIERARTYDQVENPNDFYESAFAFGRFQCLLSDYPAHTLYETIKNFHNTVDRYTKFKKAVEQDAKQRVQFVTKEIEFIKAREKEMTICQNLLEKGELPLRVTHNDTKLNNIMLDEQTGKATCIIDLDTVMPGLSIFDFGDSIRFGASTGAEDEVDLSKVSCNLELFELYTKGFIEGSNGQLTKKELDLLPLGAKIMTLECGMRFLTDYLEGDLYFKIQRPDHNLDRCRTQLRLVEDMENKWEQLTQIIQKYK